MRWYEAFAAWKTAVVLQQLYARWVRGRVHRSAHGGARPDGRRPGASRAGRSSTGRRRDRAPGRSPASGRSSRAPARASVTASPRSSSATAPTSCSSPATSTTSRRPPVASPRSPGLNSSSSPARPTPPTGRRSPSCSPGCVTSCPGLNILVANAGSGAVVPFLELSSDAWDATVALNLTGTFLCMQSVGSHHGRRCPRARTGRSSWSRRSEPSASGPGWPPTPRRRRRSTSSSGWLAYELAPHGIRVNALSPGITMTPLVASTMGQKPDILAERTADVPMGRPGEPDDMGVGRPVPVPAGVVVRHRHEPDRRRRRAPALRASVTAHERRRQLRVPRASSGSRVQPRTRVRY